MNEPYPPDESSEFNLMMRVSHSRMHFILYTYIAAYHLFKARYKPNNPNACAYRTHTPMRVLPSQIYSTRGLFLAELAERYSSEFIFLLRKKKKRCELVQLISAHDF